MDFAFNKVDENQKIFTLYEINNSIKDFDKPFEVANFPYY